jgi:hypothetical protein
VHVEDLKDAVTKALAAVRELQHALELTDAQVDDRLELLAHLDARRETALKHLEEVCEHARTAAGQGESDLKQAEQIAQTAILTARNAVVADAESVVKTLAQGQQATVVLDGHADEADAELKPRLAEVDREIRELAGQAATLTAEVQAATQETDRLVQEEVQELQRLLQELNACVEQTRETIRAECAEPIAEDEQTAATRLADLGRTVHESFELAGTHAKESAAYCGEERDRELTDALNALYDAALDVTTALGNLRDRTSEARNKAVKAADQMNEALSNGTDTVDSAIHHIDSVLGILGELGFVL